MFGKNKTPSDQRLYISHFEGWKVKAKEDWSRECCYHKNEGEDFFHGIVKGEIYFDNGIEKLCMNCAIRSNVVSDNRFLWQKESGDFVEEISPDEAEELKAPEIETPKLEIPKEE